MVQARLLGFKWTRYIEPEYKCRCFSIHKQNKFLYVLSNRLAVFDVDSERWKVRLNKIPVLT